ncbi:hypothetical protein AB4455_03575 [Vibrio sp. 10N.261.46.E12]|nr:MULTISPECIES: hypothetical protein [unclassified Vibrio]
MEEISKHDSISHPSDDSVSDDLFQEALAEESPEPEENIETPNFINNDHVNDAFSQLVNNSNANGPVGVDDNGLMSQLKPEDSLSGSDEELYSVDTQEEASFDLEDTPKDLETNNPDDSDLNDAMSFLTPQMQESANTDAIKEDESADSIEENVEIPNEYKPPFYLQGWFFIAIGITIVLALVFGVYSFIADYKSKSAQPPHQSNQVAQTVQTQNTQTKTSIEQSGTPEIVEVSSSIKSDQNVDQLFNGLSTERVQDTNDYTDIDPITQRTITSLESTILQHESDLKVSTQKVESLTNEVRVLKEQRISIQTELSQAKQKHTELQQQKVWLEEDLDKSKKEITTLKDRNNELLIDLEAEKRITAREREARISAEKRYVDLVNSRSEELKALNATVEQLRGDFRVAFDEKNSREAEKLLSQLQFININKTTMVGTYIKVRNGKPVGQPLTLEAGETVIGRGVIEKVDAYGCLTFTDGKQYQPLNGYCP